MKVCDVATVVLVLGLGAASAGCGGGDAGASGGAAASTGAPAGSSGTGGGAASGGGGNGVGGASNASGGSGGGGAGGCNGSGAPIANSGVYAEWYTGAIPDLPFVVGGQIVVEWSDVDDGTYHWDKIDTKLSQASLPTTLQVNGSNKPDYIYATVPYAVLSDSGNGPKCPSSSWSDSEPKDRRAVPGSGTDKCLVTPMYWHPAFIQAYEAMLKALADHLHGMATEKVVALRLNWDAIGTEHLGVPAAYQSDTAMGWIYPSGVPHPGDYSASVQTSYESTVLAAHIQDFTVGQKVVPPVFVRTSLEPSVLAQSTSDFDGGKLGWFMTSAEMEPRAGGGAAYSVFLDYCPNGKTLGLSESWADAWGNHGGTTDVHWATPPQFLYWRLLGDLNLGISYEDVYGNDLGIAVDGKYQGKATSYQDEFTAAFQFAAKYLGYADHPEAAPGAWIAFRPQDPNVANYAVADLAQFVSLENPGATTALDARTDGDAVPQLSMPDGEPSDHYKSIGPYQQRFGAWARRVAAGAHADLALDASFRSHLNAQCKARLVAVTYLDDKAGSKFSIAAGGQTKEVTLAGTGKWTTATLTVNGPIHPTGSGADVVLTAEAGAVTFHLVEVTF